MVLEVQMQGFGNDENSYPCIIQYVLFPPHVVPNAALERDSGTEDDTEEGVCVCVCVCVCARARARACIHRDIYLSVK